MVEEPLKTTDFFRLSTTVSQLRLILRQSSPQRI